MSKMVDTDVPFSKIEHFLQLDLYQICMQIFNEFAVFAMLSTVVFNVFAAAPPLVEGCRNSTTLFSGTRYERCQEWQKADFCEPLLRYEFYSTNVEFSSVCGRSERTWLDDVIGKLGIEDKANFSTTLQMIGLVLSSFFIGQASDTYGRQKVLIVWFGLNFLAVFASTFITSMDGYILSRFLCGVTSGCILTVTGIYVIEILPSKHRFWISTIVTWAPNYIVFAYAARYTGEWRTLARFSSGFSVVALLMLIFVLEESPKFLIQKRRKEDAVIALQKINRWSKNKASLAEIRDCVEGECAETPSLLPLSIHDMKKASNRNYSFIDLYRTRALATRTLVNSFTQFAISIITNALLFNLHSIGGSLYNNMVISGILRYVIGVSVALLDHFGASFIGRRKMHAITFGAVGLCLLVNFFMYMFELQLEYGALTRAFALIAFGLTGNIFLQIALGTSELFPTGIRSIASAHINVCGRVGNIIGPIVFHLTFGVEGLPYGMLAGLIIVEVTIYLLTIPESKGIPLPNEMPPKRLKHSASMP